MKREDDVIEPSEILMPPLVGEKKVIQEGSAWSRFLARMADYALFSLLFIVLGYFWPAFFFKKYDFFIPFLFFLWIPIEAFFLKQWGKTPGKFLLGLKVTKHGKKLGFESALKRSFLVWFRGIALGIPFLNLFAMLHAFFQLKAKKITSWDQAEKTTIVYHAVHPIRVTIALSIILFFFIFDQLINR